MAGRSVGLSWYKSDHTGRRVYVVTDLLSGRVIYKGSNRFAANKARRRLLDEYDRMDLYNQQQKAGGDQ